MPEQHDKSPNETPSESCARWARELACDFLDQTTLAAGGRTTIHGTEIVLASTRRWIHGHAEDDERQVPVSGCLLRAEADGDKVARFALDLLGLARGTLQVVPGQGVS